MTLLKLNKHTLQEAVDRALDVLRDGGIIAYPTETFYGLGVKFDVPDSLERLYDLKKRPKEKAMPLIIGDRSLLRMIVSEKWIENVPPVADPLIRRFWPGPLTLLFPAKQGLSEYLTADTGKVAARVPGESFALHLATRAGFPITATSANISGKPPAINTADVTGYFGDALDLVIDGGPTPGGLPSTIVDVSGDMLEIVREGAINRKEIEKILRNTQG